jgi:hypothetical protein
LLVDEEYVGRMVQALQPPLESARTQRQWRQVGVIADSYEEIYVLGVRLACEDGPNKRNAPHAKNHPRPTDEVSRLVEELLADRGLLHLRESAKRSTD